MASVTTYLNFKRETEEALGKIIDNGQWTMDNVIFKIFTF